MLSYIALRCVKCRVTSPALFNQWQNRPEHRVQWSSSSTQAPPLVFQRASKFQDSVALIDEHGEHTYGHILQLSGHLARLMQKVLGDVSLQQRVAFLCPNDVSYVITQWATWMAGHIAVPLYPKHPSVELEYFVRDSESAIIVTTSELTQKIKPILSGQQVIVLEDYFFKSSTAKNDNSEDDASRIMKSVINGTDVSNAGIDDHFYSGSDAMIVYTSGTTGPPKGAVLTHKNIVSQVSCLHKAWGLSSSDTILHSLPLHHCHGVVNALLCPLYVGARVVMLPEFSAANIWNHLLSLNTPVQSRVNVFMAVPTMYAKLIEEYEKKIVKNDRMREYVKAVCVQNIRLMVSGSSALPETVLEHWRQITGHTLLERYGMTEIGMALSNPLKGARKPGFVGNPLPDVEVCIARFHPGKDTYDTLCYGTAQGTKIYAQKDEDVCGELLVKGPNVFKEYWKKPQATAKEFTPNNWFRTGDTAQYTQSAYRILGRTSVDIIKSGGFKISALDVERHLLTHPNILDIAVVGVPDITWGQKVAAVIQWSASEPFDPVELKAWGREVMPHYQVPSVIVEISEALPRNNMGKVNKKHILKDFFPEVTR